MHKHIQRVGQSQSTNPDPPGLGTHALKRVARDWRRLWCKQLNLGLIEGAASEGLVSSYILPKLVKCFESLKL